MMSAIGAMASMSQADYSYLANSREPLSYMMGESGMTANNQELARKISRSETIHSGHFMLSEIDDVEAPEESASPEAPLETSFEPHVPLPVVEETTQSLDVSPTAQETTQKYTYGPRSSQTVMIDASLSKLFECMTLAYSGTLTSPKWKSFKGLRLKLKDKIRLNNIIWRAWHIQYIIGAKPTVCKFAITVDMHNKPEAVVLEGKYWKRRLDSVKAEYQKWRSYYKEKTINHGAMKTRAMSVSSDVGGRWADLFQCSNSMPGSGFDDDLISMDFSDTTLFSTLLPPNMIDFPNPRDISRSGFSADFIQPGLSQLQPPLDFMDGFEPLQDFLMSSRGLSIMPPLPEETASEANDMQGAQNKYPVPNKSSGMDSFSNKYVQNTDGTQYSKAQASAASGFQGNASSAYTSSQQPAVDLNCYGAQDKNDTGNNTKLGSSNQTYGNDNSTASSLYNSSGFVKNSLPREGADQSYSQTDFPPQSFNFMPYPSVSSASGMPPKSPSSIKSNHFAVPKLPLKSQRHRSRSSSGPHGRMSNSSHLPDLGASLAELNTKTSTEHPFVERSSSLPVYTAMSERKNRQLQASLSLERQLSANMGEMASSSDRQEPSQQRSSSSTYSMPSLVPDTTPATTFQNDPSTSLIAQLLSSSNSMTNSSLRSPSFEPSGSYNNLFTNFNNQTNQNGNTREVHPLGRFSNPRPNFTMADRSSPQQHLHSHYRAADDMSFLTPKHAQPMRKISSPGRICSPLVTSHMLISRDVSPNSSMSSASCTSPGLKPVKQKSDHEKNQYKEHRRVCHINAEQKRRCNIKNGFDTLRAILPSVSQNTNTKISKAAMLQKGADYIRTLKSERQQQQEEHDLLRQQIESLNQTISVFQNQLPVTGAPIACQRTGQTKELFASYVRERTEQNWKFWIFSIIMERLLESYDSSISTSNVDEMCKSMMRWLDQSCSLATLRRDALNSLRFLSTSTNILTNPADLPQEALTAVAKKNSSEN